jgi:hypothetical protein
MFDPQSKLSARARNILLVIGAVAVLVIFIKESSRNPVPSNVPQQTPPPVTEQQSAVQKRAPLKQTATYAARLLAAAKKESHPGLICRFACQIAASSPLFGDSKKQTARADRILDTTMYKRLRKDAAEKLQLGYYQEGLKINVRDLEGNEPTLRSEYVLFDETSAYASGEQSDSLAKTLLPIVFHRISYNDGYGHGSFVKWKANDCEEAQFGEIHALCERVRIGAESPDRINDTVANP